MGQSREPHENQSLSAPDFRERLFDDTTLSLKEIAKKEDVVGSYVTRLLRLSFLAPDIVATTGPPPSWRPERSARNRTLGDGRSPPPDSDPGPAIFRLDFPRKGSVAVGQRA